VLQGLPKGNVRLRSHLGLLKLTYRPHTYPPKLKLSIKDESEYLTKDAAARWLQKKADYARKERERENRLKNRFR
jgi:hypothetical protein